MTAASAASPRPTTSGNVGSGNAQSRAKTPLKPLEVQRVVNIGGVKYLVVAAPSATASAQQAQQVLVYWPNVQ